MKQMRRARDITSLALHASDGELGAVEDLYVDDQTWHVRYLVVRTGGWLLGRPVLITPSSVREIDDGAGALRLNVTREQIQHSPPIDRASPVSRAYEETYHRHFQLSPYWDTVPGPANAGVPYPGTIPPSVERAAPPVAAAAPGHRPAPQLRSAQTLTGGAIHAQDGEIGHVSDLVVDDEEWIVRYLEVDTGHWLPGKKVLAQISRVRDISWADRSVTVSLNRRAIESAPAYDPSELITPEYEIRLFKHYSAAAA